MGKGSKERPINKQRFDANMDRMFGVRCIKHREVKCMICSFEEHMLTPNADPRTDHPNND